MKKHLKTSLLTLSFLFMMTLQGFALDKTPSNVILEGNAQGLVSIPDDTFLEYLNMLPGDKESGIVNIRNSYEYPYKLYLRAKRVTPDEDEEYDLLDKIELKLTYKDEVIYKGPVSGAEGMEENIYLGTFNPNDAEELLAEIELDGPSTTNEYKDKFAQVDWIFSAIREYDESTSNPDSNIDGVVQPPKTGDMGIGVFLLLGTTALGLLYKNR